MISDRAVNNVQFRELNISGQSLVEIVIALALGAIIIGGASAAVIVVLQSGMTTQTQQTATILTQDFEEIGRAFTESDWHNITNLTHGSSTTYYFLATSSVIIALEGKEGITEGDIRTGLVGHWKLDEATSTAAYDYSDYMNDGTSTGAVATTTSCKAGGCYEFDGINGLVEIADMGISGQNNVTFAAWAKVTGTSDCSSLLAIMSSGSSIQNGIHISGSSCQNIIFKGQSSANADGTTAVPPDFDASRWNHFVGVSDSSAGMLLYLNGALVSSNTSSFSPADITNGYEIGHAKGHVSRYFEGQIDDVRIYNRALSADEVNHLYDSTAFTRYFYVENVCRTNDSDYALAGVSPCDGGEVNDPSTQKMTSVIEWETRTGSQSFELPIYLTRWQNKAFHQSDWSGGSGETGTVTDKTNKFTSSTDIDAGSIGSFRLEGL